jgi:predicted O-linked N-acetylglucosamine transferase (SPINDLY family)
LGNALRDIGDYAGALESFQQALRFQTKSVETLMNLGNVLREFGRADEAMQSLRRALELNPQFVEACSNLGNLLLDCGQLEEAFSYHKQAIERAPDFADLRNNYLMSLQYDARLSRQDIFTAHREFGERFELPLKPQWPNHAQKGDPNKRLKIGYVSGDFRRHAVSFFIEPVFVNRDKSQVEIFCYSNCAAEDDITQRLIASVDHWHPCYGLTDDQLAQQILADGIDILVDLSGHSSRNRLLSIARKPAPIQVTYLGYPGGTGLSAVDYRLTDQYAEPETASDPADRYYTETLFRLPDSLWCYNPAADMPEITPLPAIANGYFTFGSFNNVNKIDHESITLWSTLLKRIPTSRLVMATVPEGHIRDRLLANFAEQGIDASRINFYGKLPSHEFQRKLQEVDISLDPLNVNGATTTCESLWLGVPVLTLVGKRFLSRAGFSVLSAAQMTEFAATNEAEFIDTAIRFANDLPQLSKIRTEMRQRLRNSALLDQRRYTRNLEQAYREMWQRFLQH